MLRVLCVKSTSSSYFITRWFAIEFFIEGLTCLLIKNHIAGKLGQTNERNGGRQGLFWTSRKSTRHEMCQNVGKLCPTSRIQTRN